MRVCRVVVFISVLIFGACSNAPKKPETIAAGDYGYVQDHIRWLVRKEMSRHQIAGLSLALVDEQRVIWAEGFGAADVARNIPATPQTIYRAGSITKLFTATAVMQLAEQNRIDIDAPLTRYLPEFRMRSRFTDTRAITVRDLLTHHAGLPGNYLHGMWNPEPEPVALLLQRLANEDVSFPPGHVLSYSNIGFDLLGLVIERVSGERYEDYVRRHVLEPLAMNSASIESGFSGANVARAYRDGKETPESPMRDVPAGGLNVSAIELTRFARMALNGGVLDGRNVLRAETLAEMWRAQNADVPLDFDHHVGLGWGVNRTGDLDIPGAGRVPHHSGGTLQFHSNLVVLPDDGLAVVVMANSAESGPAVSRITKTLITLALEARTGRTGRRDITSMRAATATATEDWSGHYDTLLGYSAIRSDGGDHYLDTFDKKFVLRRGDDGALHVRYRLFGFIPVSAPGLSHAAIARETIGNNVVLSAEEHGRRRLAGSLIQPNRIDAVWRARLGRYDFNNAGQDVLLFEQNELVERDGVLLWRRAHPLFGEGVATFALSPLSDTEAVVEGLGAGRGEVLRFDPVSGRLRYSGYELVRVP